MRLFWRDGRRWTAEQLYRYGVAEGREAEAGFLPLDAAQPAHDPLFDLPVDRGTIIEAVGARIDWEIVDRRLDAVCADLKAKVADLRWQAETGGMKVNGVLIQTDRESRGNLTGAALRADRALRNGTAYEVRWKAADGWAVFDASTILAVAEAAEAHVNACFVREAEIVAQVDAAVTIDDLRAIDLSSGWPE